MLLPLLNQRLTRKAFSPSTITALAIAFVMLLSLTPCAQAQYRASIQGVVTDPNGAVIPGAQLTLIDKATNFSLATTSNRDGIYNFEALPPSHFKLTVVMSGFQTRVIDNLTLIPEQPNSLNVQLAVGATSASVTVNATEVPNLDTETASISGTITSNQIEHMAAFGRDVTELAQLAPGVLGDGSLNAGGGAHSLPGTNQGSGSATGGIFTTENGPQVIGNGTQSNTNNVTIDGISVSSVTWGGTTVITPTEESVDSVKITSNAYDAENGRFSGTEIQITSKSGSNQYHGSLFFKGERPGLNAYQRWTNPNPSVKPVKDTARYNDFGGSVSGPAWKNRIFPSFAYETLRNNGTVYGSGWYETPAFDKLAPTGSNAALYLGYPGEGVSYTTNAGGTCTNLGLPEGGPYCYTIAGQGVNVGSPLTSGLGKHDPTFTGTSAKPETGSGASATGIADLSLYNTVGPNQSIASQYYGRVDGQIDSKDRASFMIYWVPQSKLSYNGGSRAANLYNHSQVNDAFTGLWDHTFSSTLINEARVNAGGWRWNEINTNPQEAFGLSLASFGAGGNYFPALNPNVFGAPSPSVFDQWTFGYQDILTKSLGKHTIKAGGVLTRLYYLNESAGNARPSYVFAGLWDFLNDAPYSESGNFNPATGIPTSNREDNRENLWAAFVQDDWKLTPNLTVNLGIRYSYFGPYYDKDNQLKKVVMGSGSALITGLTVVSGSNEWVPQKDNFGPELGFAWNPNYLSRKAVVRGGFGMNYNEDEMAITAQSIGNPGNTVSASFCCSTATSNGSSGQSILYQLPSNLHQIFGFPANPAAKTSFAANGLPSNTATTLSVTGFDANPKTIMTYHYSLDTQYDIGHGWVAFLGYQGSASHHLLLQQDMKVLAVAAGDPLSSQITRVGYYGNKGNANYNAMLATLTHNFAHGIQAEAQYTWSKSMDNGSQPYYQDMYPYNLHYSWGRSDYNVQNAFKLFGMYQTSFHKQGWMHAADGWTLSGIFNVHAGFPWTPSYSGVGNIFYGGSGQSTLRPAAYNGQAKHNTSNAAFEAAPGTAASNFPSSTTTGAPFFTEPTFTAVSGNTATAGPLPQAPGVARNSFNGPGYKDVDATLSKAFALPGIKGENSNLEFRIDAFNLFNDVNLNSPATNITATTFGQSQGAMGSRIVDMQARFSF